MLCWENFIGYLGCKKNSVEFIALPQIIGEAPAIEEDLDEKKYLGNDKYYSFLKSGILIILENNSLKQVTLYLTEAEGFSTYKGCIPVPRTTTEIETIDILGTPSITGGGEQDSLIGYIERWIKYKRKNYDLHMQFSITDSLSKISLISH